MPHLPELASEALAVTRQIQDESARSYALRALVPHLPELASEALELTRQIQDEYARSSALRALVPHLPESLLSEALELTRQIQDEYYQATALAGIAPKLHLVSSDIGFWGKALHTLSRLKRSELIPALAKLEPLITALGGKAALQQMMQAMREVCSQWR